MKLGLSNDFYLDICVFSEAFNTTNSYMRVNIRLIFISEINL